MAIRIPGDLSQQYSEPIPEALSPSSQISTPSKGPGTRKPVYPLQAVPDLLEQGAQFVLCDYWGNRKADGTQSKKPVHRNWRRQRPGFGAVKDHIDQGGLLGIVPASLGCAVLDVDQGNPTELIASHLPWFLSPTQRSNGLHLWYQDSQGNRYGGRWRHSSGCGGELLASTGYVILWAHALQGLADVLQYQTLSPGDQADFGSVTSSGRMTWANPGERLEKNRESPPTEDGLPDLADVLPGRRNVSLFHHVRYYAYRQVKHHTEFPAFADEVTGFAVACRSQLPDLEGFPESEAQGIASSVATWTWTVLARGTDGQRPEDNHHTAPFLRPTLGDTGYRGDPALNADSEVQRYRRSCRTYLDGVRVTARVKLAAARSVTGQPVAVVATAIGVSQRQVQRYLEAAKLPSKRQAKRTLATERAKAQRAARQASKADCGTAQLTGGEVEGAPLKPWLSGTQAQQAPKPTPNKPTPKTPIKKDAPRRSPPDYGLVSQQAQRHARDGPGDGESGGSGLHNGR